MDLAAEYRANADGDEERHADDDESDGGSHPSKAGGGKRKRGKGGKRASNKSREKTANGSREEGAREELDGEAAGAGVAHAGEDGDNGDQARGSMGACTCMARSILAWYCA